MNATKTNHFWSGSANATEAGHDAMYERYAERFPLLMQYRFAVNDYLDEARVARDGKYAANGIWTLAEMLANGESEETIERVARLMNDAAKKE